MTQEEKELLLVDLCARLPYHTIVKYRNADIDLTQYARSVKLVECVPYLRPMPSMTEEEKFEYNRILSIEHEGYLLIEEASDIIDFYNSKHLDYRGLIPMGLALEAPEDMYK